MLIHKISILFLAITISGTTFAQPIYYDQSRIDRLERLLPTMPNDSSKIDSILILAGIYLNDDSTISMKYARLADTLSQQIKFDRGRVKSLSFIAFHYAFRGNWPKSFVAVNMAMPLAEKVYPHYKLFLYTIMFVNYALYKQDYVTAKTWALKSLHDPAFPSLPETSMWPTYMQLTDAYTVLGNLDSAKYFATILKGFHSVKLAGPGLRSNSYRVLGNIEMKERNYQSALDYYKVDDENALYAAYAFDSLKKKDSAILYGKIAFENSIANVYPLVTLESSLLLANLYAESNPKVSNDYYKIYIQTNKDLYNSNRIKEQEELSLNQQKNRFEKKAESDNYRNRIVQISLIALAAVFLISALLFFRSNKIKQQANQKLEKAYSELKSTQAQLIQSEKMASLGELTAGIAHEIQNPLNFVNNFSEVNKELINELKGERLKVDGERDSQLENDILNDIGQNLEKISHHGKRADSIVKGMLQHSRTNSGQKELTDINALADEYLRLSYHGMRAKDKSFNAELQTKFDGSISELNINPQEIGRVLLNLYNNAFYAVNERKKQLTDEFLPKILVSTEKSNGVIKITVMDNGSGIPAANRDKIFQPFFTTKPTGEGTGLGLSLAYDIVTKGHGGQIEIGSSDANGTAFIIHLPIQV